MFGAHRSLVHLYFFSTWPLGIFSFSNDLPELTPLPSTFFHVPDTGLALAVERENIIGVPNCSGHQTSTEIRTARV